MAVRIQPYDIEVPEDDPFKHDLLDRKESVEVLTHLVSSFDGPCVLAVDAAWGNGKTTFLKMWRQHLRNHEFPVVDFNAWETDFAGNPFLALSTELTEELQEFAGLDEKLSIAKEQAKEVMRRVVPGIIRAVTAGALNVDTLLENELGGALASIAENSVTEYKSAKRSIAKFRNTLQDIANTVSQSRSNRPLILMIDELDRCRPSYAVELLEIAKHLFSVNHLVFILAINRSELGHSIKALYGTDFDANGYLRRFVDIDFRLPDPDRKDFIKSALAQIRIDDYFSRTQDRQAGANREVMQNMVQVFFRTPHLSLRQIGQSIHRLGLVFASLRSDQLSFALSAVVALIFRTINTDLYHQFCRHEISDLKAMDLLFGSLGGAAPPLEHERSLFEATVIAGWCEMAHPQGLFRESIDSPLYVRYKEEYDEQTEANEVNRPKLTHAATVFDVVERFCLPPYPYGRIGFLHSVRRIELLSGGLMDDAISENGNS